MSACIAVMGARQDARSLARQSREELLENSRTMRLDDYDARPHGNSLETTISPFALDELGIEEGTTIEQFINTDTGALILIPEGHE